MREQALPHNKHVNQPTHRWRAIVGLLLLAQVLVPGGSAWASSVEHRVKAAFLYNFTKYIEWPAASGTSNQPFRIGILGQDPISNEAEQLAGKTVGRRRMIIQRFPVWNRDAAACDILFISETHKNQVEEVIRRVDGLPVLTVGDTPAYARRGVMINFFMVDNKVRFTINLDKAKAAGFSISSRLLKLASVLEQPVE